MHPANDVRMNVRSRLTSAILCALTLSSCGSPAADINFAAPGAGWTATPAILGRTQIWMKNEPNSNTHDSLVILVRGVGQSQNFLNSPGVSSTGSRILKQRQTKICGNQPAEYVLATGKYNGVASGGSTGKPATFEAYLSTVRDVRYMAIYIHPQNQPADEQAETAIRSLCPKTS